MVSPYGTVVYGTGYAYSPWIGGVWYAPPYTYGYAAAPIYNPWVGYTFGFAMGLATAAWMEPYWGGAYYHPGYWGGYGCCGVASANVYGHWGNAAYSGTRSWYAGGGVAGSTFSGSYATARGTTGNIDAGRQYNAWTGNATRGYDRNFNTAAGGYGNVARGSNYNTYTGQRSTGSAVSATGAGGSSYDRAGATTAGPQGCGPCGRRLDLQRQDRPDQHLEHGQRGQQPLRRRQRQRAHQHRQRLATAFRERMGRLVGRHVVGRPRIAGAQCRGRPLGRLLQQLRRRSLRR